MPRKNCPTLGFNPSNFLLKFIRPCFVICLAGRAAIDV